MSLSGGTATAFRRVLKANRDISYDDAVAHIRRISVDRDLRRDLHHQMETLSMQSGERMDNFLKSHTVGIAPKYVFSAPS